VAFLCARYLVRGFVQVYVDRHPRMAAVDRAVESEGLRLVFLLRLSPVVPYILLNYVLGVSRLRFRDYVGGLAGMLPTIAMYVYAGKVAGDLAAQIEQAWDNLLAVLASEGMSAADLVKITFFTTDGSPEALKLSREIRARKLGDVAPSSTFLVIAGLAGPDLKVEIEGEAVAAA
jgi:enamine deaminase RidA (YjgF/YER057c/UK114 family)